MLKLIKSFLLFFLLSHVLLATTKQRDLLQGAKSAPTIPENKSGMYDQFLRATYLHAKGDNPAALKAFEEVVSEKREQATLEPYINLLFDSEKFEQLVQVYEQNQGIVDEIMKKNFMVKASIAQGYLSTGKIKKATQLFNELLASNGNDVQLNYFIAVGYLKTGNHKFAIDLLLASVANHAFKNKHYLFHFLLSKAYLETNKITEAMKSIEESIALFPRFERGWLFKAILHEQQGKINDAIKGYKKFLDLAGRDQGVEKQLIQLLFGQERFGEAAEYLKKLSQDSPEYSFDLALMQSKNLDYEAALHAINRTLSFNPTDSKARLLKIEILLNSKKIEEAMSTIKVWFDEDPQNISTLHVFLLLHSGGVSAELLMHELESLKQKHPNNLGILATLGDLALEAKKFDKALEFYQEANTQTTYKKLKSAIYSQRCFVLFEQQNFTDLLAEIAKAEQDRCLNDRIFNLHAYFLGSQGKELDKALVLIDQALSLAPDTPAYLDTKALVLSKMQKFEEALQVAQKALSLAPQDPIIQKTVEGLQAHVHQPSNKKKTNNLRSSW